MGAEKLKIENGELKMREPVTCNFSMAEVFSFLEELRENNNREWFNAHKEWYLAVKAEHEDFINRVIPVLAVTEPTALPTAMSAFPSKAENSDTSSSGMVVAKLTTVAPMINFGMPVDSAIHVAASTNRSPPFMIQNRPAPNRASTKNRLLPVRSSGMDDPSNDCFCRGPQAIGSKILQT
mgnify:CR=1 FL=1